MKHIDNYKFWLSEVSRESGIPEEQILAAASTRKNYTIVEARNTFYYLCWIDGIDIYRLSELFGKHRTTIKNCLNSKQVKSRDKTMETKIWNNVKTRESKETV